MHDGRHQRSSPACVPDCRGPDRRGRHRGVDMCGPSRRIPHPHLRPEFRSEYGELDLEFPLQLLIASPHGRAPGQPIVGLSDGVTYYYASFLYPVAVRAADDLLCGRRSNTPNAFQRKRVRMYDPGTSGATAPAFPTAAGATIADGTAVWTCLGSEPIIASATATGVHGYAERLYGLLPEPTAITMNILPEVEVRGRLADS